MASNDVPSVAQHEHVALEVRIEFSGDRHAVPHVPGIGMEYDHCRSRFRKLPVSLFVLRYARGHRDPYLYSLLAAHLLRPALGLPLTSLDPFCRRHGLQLRSGDVSPSCGDHIRLDLELVGRGERHIFIWQAHFGRGGHICESAGLAPKLAN